MKIIKIFSFLLVLVFDARGASREPTLAEVEALAGKFLSEAIQTRDVRSVLEWFCKEGDYAIYQDGAATESAAKLNFSNERDLYFSDREKLMNLIPMAGLNSLGIVKVERVAGSNRRYKVTFRYGEGAGRFHVISPDVVSTENGVQVHYQILGANAVRFLMAF